MTEDLELEVALPLPPPEDIRLDDLPEGERSALAATLRRWLRDEPQSASCFASHI